MRIPSEDLYAFNIDKQIERFFQELGYEVKLTDKPTRREESKLGFDSLFKKSGVLKYFAIQYKRPKVTSLGIRFDFSNQNQHKILVRNSNWMFYGLPYFTDYSFLEVALHYFFVAPAKDTQEFMSWGQFTNLFLACRLGLKEEKERVKSMLLEEYPLDNYSSYVFDLTNGKVLIVSKYGEEKLEYEN